MKKTYFPPSILVLASQGFVGPNIGSGDDDAELQPEENDDNGSTQSAKWSNSFFSISAWLITCRHTLTIYCGAESTVHGWYKK